MIQNLISAAHLHPFNNNHDSRCGQTAKVQSTQHAQEIQWESPSNNQMYTVTLYPTLSPSAAGIGRTEFRDAEQSAVSVLFRFHILSDRR